jgi:choloylglycine hydrolase
MLRKLIVVLLITVFPVLAYSCSRIVYLGADSIVMVGRTLDWRNPIPTNIYVYPKGISKQSMPSGKCLEWKSKYRSVIAVGYDGGVTEGMNSAGLIVNGLFCKESVYTSVAQMPDAPLMSLAMFVSYFLDNFATVDEVETWLYDNKFVISGKTFDGGTVSLLHWAFTDRIGMTLVIEYDAGVLKTYKSEQLQVLTNDPPLSQMQAIEKYWNGVGGNNMLPGTVRSADRFVRASYFVKHIPRTDNEQQAFTGLNSIINSVTVPFGYEVEGMPNLSSTQWRSIADAKMLRYYFALAESKGYIWIDLDSVLDDNVILKYDMTQTLDVMGNVTKNMTISQGFTPMW